MPDFRVTVIPEWLKKALKIRYISDGKQYPVHFDRIANKESRDG